MTLLHTTLIHAVTSYDRRQQELSERNPRRYYNPYALAQYLEAETRFTLLLIFTVVMTVLATALAVSGHEPHESFPRIELGE